MSRRVLAAEQQNGRSTLLAFPSSSPATEPVASIVICYATTNNVCIYKRTAFGRCRGIHRGDSTDATAAAAAVARYGEVPACILFLVSRCANASNALR